MLQYNAWSNQAKHTGDNAQTFYRISCVKSPSFYRRNDGISCYWSTVPETRLVENFNKPCFLVLWMYYTPRMLACSLGSNSERSFPPFFYYTPKLLLQKTAETYSGHYTRLNSIKFCENFKYTVLTQDKKDGVEHPVIYVRSHSRRRSKRISFSSGAVSRDVLINCKLV